jgi:hypothetical protein
MIVRSVAQKRQLDLNSISEEIGAISANRDEVHSIGRIKGRFTTEEQDRLN